MGTGGEQPDMTTHITANPLETGNDELERYALEECHRRQRTDHGTSVLFMLLLEAGASVLRTMTTTHGNVKGVAVRV